MTVALQTITRIVFQQDNLRAKQVLVLRASMIKVIAFIIFTLLII